MDIIENLKSLLVQGQDNAVLRFSLGNAYLNIKKYPEAIEHFARAVELDPEYSAAWKHYGRALVENEQNNEAIIVYEKGISVAEKKGDIQAAREMKVFLKRIKNR